MSRIRDLLARFVNRYIRDFALHISKREREKAILEGYTCLDQDERGTHGVLLSDEIRFYVDRCRLIDPFNEESLKPAAYELRVGYEYAMDGKIKRLSEDTGNDFVEVPPFQVVVIKTMERINLPRFLIARWNIRVRKAYEGLLWVGGPQVDPGYVGYLSCPIYNLSDKKVKLSLGEHIAVIDFVKTTPFTKKEKPSEQDEYKRPPKRIVFEDYEPETLKSALFTQAETRVADIEQRVRRFETYISLAFVAITVLFTALTLFVTGKTPANTTGQSSSNTWVYLSLVFSIIAVAAVLVANRRLVKDHLFKTIVFVWLALLTLNALGMYAQLYAWIIKLFHHFV